MKPTTLSMRACARWVSMSWWREVLSAGLLGSMSFAMLGCGEERVEPVVTTSDDASSNASGTGASGGAAPVPVRSVFARNPIGTPLDNLLADGDFELSIVPSEAAGGQYGWRAFLSSGAQLGMDAETGGLCRTGLRCARVGKGAVLFGQGTAAADRQPHRASIWVKPVDPSTVDPEKPCDLLKRALVVRCDSFASAGTLVAADAPNEDGWCEFADDVPGSRDALCFYLELETPEVLLDSATLVAATGPSVASADLELPVDDATRSRLEEVRGWVRSRMPLSPTSLPFDHEGRPRDPRLRRPGAER